MFCFSRYIANNIYSITDINTTNAFFGFGYFSINVIEFNIKATITAIIAAIVHNK